MTTEPRGNKERDAASTDAVPNTAGVRMLKFAVAGMAVLIAAGLGAVMWKIVELADENKTAVNSARPSIAVVKSDFERPAELTPEARLALPKGATIRSVSLSGNRLAVHYETAAGAEIAILDLESGKALTRVTLPVGP